VRPSGAPHAKTCPMSLATKMLKDKNPRNVKNHVIYKVSMKEMGPLVEEMNANNFDCNFWYIN
jgi:hypothetical protein